MNCVLHLFISSAKFRHKCNHHERYHKNVLTLSKNVLTLSKNVLKLKTYEYHGKMYQNGIVEGKKLIVSEENSSFDAHKDIRAHKPT